MNLHPDDKLMLGSNGTIPPNIVVRYVTILAPADSPNTDGIDPDSSSNVCIEDSYISTGDDLVAVKSGWDEYGIAYGHPSSDITIRRIRGSSPFSGIAIGSETSGGVENVFAEHINLHNVGVGIHIKTNICRGGFIRNITVSNVFMEKARKGIKIAGDVGDHPDDKFNPNALPVVKGITLTDIWGIQVLQAGPQELPFHRNLSFQHQSPWHDRNNKNTSMEVLRCQRGCSSGEPHPMLGVDQWPTRNFMLQLLKQSLHNSSISSSKLEKNLSFYLSFCNAKFTIYQR
ncbi:putative galacturan 1,4-alpha-galacturonidase [Rosa chinensis]|uniref:Putative galacturan 1,4-alpha-galacturonidase n=1 Tax=Rosa chinensis TaxID=74649 RepID=A0A2P6PJ86_ROSCH|nr:putative galacturan 1,4-alpha-galacturonidase [Rosa chinensis]